MREAIIAGADMINDINGFRAPGAIEAVRTATAACASCTCRVRRRTCSRQPVYTDVVREVIDFLRERVDAMLAAGIARERICVDPGFGFGKTVEHNYALLRATGRIDRNSACRCWRACRASR
jgi:dihydropteroate synthase